MKLKDLKKEFLEKSPIELAIREFRENDPNYEWMFKNFKKSFLEADKETLLSVIFFLSMQIDDLKRGFFEYVYEEKQEFDEGTLGQLINRLTFLEEDFRKIKKKVKRLG